MRHKHYIYLYYVPNTSVILPTHLSYLSITKHSSISSLHRSTHTLFHPCRHPIIHPPIFLSNIHPSIQPPISLHPTTPPTKHATNLTNLTIVCACVHRLCLSSLCPSSLYLSSLCLCLSSPRLSSLRLSSLLLSFIVSGSFQSLAASIVCSSKGLCVYRLCIYISS